MKNNACRKDINVDMLLKLYTEDKLSLTKIAKTLSINRKLVDRALQNLGVKTRIRKVGFNPIGRKTKFLEIVEYDYINDICVCKCLREGCNNTVKAKYLDFDYGLITSCGDSHRRVNYIVGEIPIGYWNIIKKRDENYTITPDYIWTIFLKQNRRCALSGEKLCFYKHYADSTKQTASLDRINSKIGYIIGNVQWVHKDVNYMKTDMTDQELINWCDKISSYRGNKRS